MNSQIITFENNQSVTFKVQLKRCFKCNHKSTTCKIRNDVKLFKDRTCFKCNSLPHLTKDCKNAVFKCNLCKKILKKSAIFEKIKRNKLYHF